MSNWNNNEGNWGSSHIQSPWDNFEEIEPKRAKNEYVPAGVNGIVEIVHMKTVQSIKNNNRPIFVASIELIEGTGGEIGTRWDWVAKADERAYLQNIKTLICSLNPDGDPASFGRELMEQLTSAAQPAKGLKVRLRTEAIVTSKGYDFTKVHWSPA